MPAATFKNILEKTTRRITGTIVDELDAGIPAATLSTMVLTLYALPSAQAIINSRNVQNVLNANNISIDDNGNFVWDVQPADNAILDATLTTEQHRALFEWTWSGGTKAGKDEIDLHVRNLHKVT